MSHNYQDQNQNQEPDAFGAVPIVVNQTPRLPRRTVIKWFVAVAASLQLGDAQVFGAEPGPGEPVITANGYGKDPLLNQTHNPGDLWPLTLSPAQRAAAIALADVILPADNLGPAASQLRCVDFLDEWVSAPYPAQLRDRELVLPGLDWLDVEAGRRFGDVFASLTLAQQQAICDDICFEPRAGENFKTAARFFSRFRSLAAAAYYATTAGWEAIGYVGNQPSLTYDGPPDEVLARLGVEQTVA
ncbi:MAG: Tat pathway signal protein [Gammaproteobacteria bacterium]|nr:Tat pathway signal protein [Gammaproteobacteria bacterium]|tara:strand:- start:504 stop:1235 length:732 start_codon:yes stop_codon:yes gene_type:complete